LSRRVHLVACPDLLMLLSRTLENEGYEVTGTGTSWDGLVESLKSKTVDASATVIIEGGAGLRHPPDPNEITRQMARVRKVLKRTRFIVQLEPMLERDVEFIRTMVHLGVHDLQFTDDFRTEEVLTWIRERKTTRDYYSVLGKPESRLLSLFRPMRTAVVAGEPGTGPEIADYTKDDKLSRPETAVRNPTIPREPAPLLAASGEEDPELAEAEAKYSSSAATVGSAAVSSHIPLQIGICGAGGEEDVGAAVFLLAASLAQAGWKPLVCGDDRPEISSLEQIVFDGEKEDLTSKMFEYEGVTFCRRGYVWNLSELLTGGFTHILLWLDIHEDRKGTPALELWWNTQIPLLVGSGSMWKYELLKEKLNTLGPYELRRCRLLLENGRVEVLQKLAKDFPQLQASLLPEHQDPLYPDQQAVRWVMELLRAEKKLLRRNVKVWGIVGIVLFATFLLLVVGLTFTPGADG